MLNLLNQVALPLFTLMCVTWATIALGQEPQSSAVLTIEGIINGQATEPTRVFYAGAAEVAHCVEVATTGSAAHQEAMTSMIVSYQALRQWDSGQFTLSCDGWLATRLSQSAEPVAFDAVPAIPAGAP